MCFAIMELIPIIPLTVRRSYTNKIDVPSTISKFFGKSESHQIEVELSFAFQHIGWSLLVLDVIELKSEYLLQSEWATCMIWFLLLNNSRFEHSSSRIDGSRHTSQLLNSNRPLYILKLNALGSNFL